MLNGLFGWMNGFGFTKF